MRIIDLLPDNKPAIKQAAQLLVDGFKQNWPNAWPTLKAARQEVQGLFDDDCISRMAVDERGLVLGWIGGVANYSGNVWELHPLVVRVGYERKGIGRALVRDLAAQARQRGGLTLWVGTDDENNLTSLAGVNLYPDPLSHLLNIRNLRQHPYEFYQKLGFVLAGIVPDANGPGKPDILLVMPLT